jgi:hypothetical protein
MERMGLWITVDSLAHTSVALRCGYEYVKIMIMKYVAPLTYLTEQEWQELLSLEYVLTWHYTDDFDRDGKRHMELSAKRWGE